MQFYIAVAILLMLVNMISVFSLIFIERKDPTTTWAWLLILLLIPGVGFIVYLLLGQNLSRQKIFREKKIIDKTRAAGLEEMQEIHGIKMELQDEYSDLILMNYNQCGSIYTTGNEVKTYISGEKKFQDLIKDIRSAKSFIHIEYYIFRFDDLGKAIIDELKSKVDEDVEVRLLVDGMGSKNLKQKEIRYIKSLGIKFSIFFPGAFPRINTRINYRNHRKIVIIDGEIGYVGGFNVGNEYVNRGHQFKFSRDTHFKVKVLAVNELYIRFILDWDYASNENFDNIIKYFPKPKEYGRVGMQIVSSGPDHMDEYIKIAYMKIINNARKYVYIQTPYLVPDEPILEALRISALSGVDVRIIVPDKPDHFFMEWVLSANIANLIDYGVKIYRYNNGFIHSKTIVSDDIVSSIGTANMDNRSFRLNFEVNAFIYDGVVAKEQSKIFLNDQKFSTFVTKEAYEKRSRVLRIKESLIKLVSPIL